MREKTTSEIISGALDIFGPKGEHWNNHTLHGFRNGIETFCAIGGLQKAAIGGTLFSGYTGANGSNLNKAVNLILEEVNSKKNSAICSIPTWNDSHPSGTKGFKQIKEVFCSALQRALDKEKVQMVAKTEKTKKTTPPTKKKSAKTVSKKKKKK